MSGLQPVAIAARELVHRAVSDGRRLGFSLTYVEGAGRELKAAGANWFGPRRMWVREATTTADALGWLARVMPGQHFDIESSGPLIDAALARPEPDFFTQLLDVQVFPLTTGGLAVSALYDAPTLRCMRALDGRFHKHASAWEIHRPVAEVLGALRQLAGIAPEFVFVHERPVVLEALVAVPASPVPLTVPAAKPVFGGDGDDGEQDGTGFISTIGDEIERLPVDETALHALAASAGLRDYQVVGVRHLLSQTSALLADDMGLGKSRQTVCACRLAAGKGRVLIVCPATLRINWEREIRAVYHQAVVGMVGEDRMQTLYGCDWIIANYERLGGLVREPDLALACMAVDEAHFLKEHQSGRTRNAFVLAARIPRRFLVTGTPLLSREVEMHTLLRMSGHALGRMELAEFRKQYAGGQDQRAALAQRLQGWMLRRRKDVLTDLGKKGRQLRYVSPAEGLGAYENVMKDMTLAVMPKITKLRQTLEALKTEFLIETAASLGADDKLIIFCEYMQTVETLKQAMAASGIGCVSLVGSDASGKRQKAIDAFQSDASVKVFIGTTSAAGVGITLTAASIVAFASLPWTPALMRQAEDRAYRLGQKGDVLVIVPLIPGTIDEKVWQLIGAKTELEEEVVEAVRAELECA